MTLWVNIRVFFLREKEGKRLFYASLKDMTELKKDTVVPEHIEHELEDLTDKQRDHMEKYFGNIPSPFGVGQPVVNEDGKVIDYKINYANKAMSRMCGGNMERLRALILKFFEDRIDEFLDASYRAAYNGEKVGLHMYSKVSKRYFDVNIYQYQYGYACCMMQDVTLSHIYESVAGNIMESFREVYFLQLQDNYCSMVYPDESNLLNRGNYEEVISRKFESGKICAYDEAGVREFLSLDNIKKMLRKRDSIEYKYKRSVEPVGEEWCITTITVSERVDGVPKTATVTVRSIESLMREKESKRHQNMAKMLETMSDGFFIYMAEDDERLLYANPLVLHLFGCKNSTEFKELTNNTFTGLVHPEDLNRVEREIHSQVKESDRNMDYIRYRIIRKDGSIRWIDDVGHLETSEYIDGPKMFYVFISDVTDSITEAEKNALINESKYYNK